MKFYIETGDREFIVMARDATEAIAKYWRRQIGRLAGMTSDQLELVSLGTLNICTDYRVHVGRADAGMWIRSAPAVLLLTAAQMRVIAWAIHSGYDGRELQRFDLEVRNG